MKILVLGAGQQGRVIARDLAASLPSARIDVADVRPGAGSIQADLADPRALVRLLSEFDLAVGALPSHLGFNAMRAAIEARKNLVDLSFCAEDALSLDAEARRAGVAILPDCGLAPGISNLLVGVAAKELGRASEIHIGVGGIPQDPNLPYGYVITWSVDDLLQEYTRPARIIADARPASVPALTGLERLRVDGVGELEAFLTDGLRTLLETVPGVRTMDEKTLRWPGHVDAIRPLLQRGTLVETFRRECTRTPAHDLVVLYVDVRGPTGRRRFEMVDRFDPATGMTAMARTTALTCSAVAQWAASRPPKAGVYPLERLPESAEFILQRLESRGIHVRRNSA
jgi:saccharopine dehydrogenase-like NADP-dependent oxidoreductase